jgi:alpha-galactosidase
MKRTKSTLIFATAALLIACTSCGSRTGEIVNEEKTILTPHPAETVRINGARIFGVRPGSPFIFKIPATGKKPLKYEVIDLPEGLEYNPETGMITGRLENKGEYMTTFRVTNELGTAEKPFRIVCGQTLAVTPHMGWNSWYVWENHITEKIMREAADAMVSSGMIQIQHSEESPGTQTA